MKDIIGVLNSKTVIAYQTIAGDFEPTQDMRANNVYTFADAWISMAKYPKFMKDANGDGKADIVGFSHRNLAVGYNYGKGILSEIEEYYVTDKFGFSQGYTTFY